MLDQNAKHVGSGILKNTFIEIDNVYIFKTKRSRNNTVEALYESEFNKSNIDGMTLAQE